MAINPNEINIKNIIELIQSSSIQDNDLLVIGQGIYARKSTVLELYNKFGVPSILTSLNSLQLQINQLNNTVGNSVLYSPQVKTPQQKADARNNLDVYSKTETQTVVNSAIINLGNVVNSVTNVNPALVDNSDPKNPVIAEFREISDYNNDMLNKADIDGNLTTGGIWWQDQVLSDRFANYKQVWTALTNNTIEWGNIELDKHIFLVDDVDGLKIKVGSTEGTIWNTLNLTNVSQLNNDAGYLQANDLDGFIYDVQYNSATHTITFYQQNEPNIVIDLPIEQLIKGVQLVGDDLVFTFEDGSTVTVPLNTLLVGVVKSVNGLTPNSQGEIILNVTDIPNLSSELDNKLDIRMTGLVSNLTQPEKDDILTKLGIVNNIVQVLGLSGNTITLSNGGGSISLNIVNIGGLQSELDKIGNLPSLTTTNKNNLVDAINEVNGNIPTPQDLQSVLNTGNEASNTHMYLKSSGVWSGTYYSDYTRPSSGGWNRRGFEFRQYALGDILENRISIGASSVGYSYIQSIKGSGVNTSFRWYDSDVDGIIRINTRRIPLSVNGTFADASGDIGISLPTVNDGLLTISTSSDLTGGGTFSANQATASNVNIGLSAGTLSSLALANTALQSGDNVSELNNDVGYLTSFTEIDPIFTASPAYGISSADITNWNSKTSNTGTVTSITAGTGLSGGTITTSGTIALNSATLASLALADTALQSGDDISELNNDAGYITSSSLPTNYITTNTNQTGLTGNKSVDGTWTFNNQINTANHGNSSQWKQAYDWGDYSLNTIVFNDTTNNPTNNYNGLDADLTLNTSRLFFTSGLNTPITSGFIDTTVYSNGAFQMIQGDQDNFYYRRRFGGAWRAWNQVASREWVNSQNFSTQTLTAGANIQIVGNVISATDTNTTYTAGTGLSLTGTTFGQVITTSGTGSFVTGITQTTNGFQVNLGTPPNTVYTGSNGINVTGTVISPTYGTTANTIAQGDDVRINNGQTAYDWGDFRDYNLGRTVSSPNISDFSSIDGDFETRIQSVTGTFFGIGATARPQGLLSKGGVNTRWSYLGTTDSGVVRIYATNSSNSNTFVEVIHTGNFNPAQYVLQSSLNTQLANYVPINGVTTINNTKTFTSSPIVPNATLNGHTVNLGQLNTILGDYATETWVTQQINNISIPTVNDGQLSIATGTGLSGSVNFTANQAGNSSVTIDIASGFVLPTIAQVNTWNNAISSANLALGTRTATTMPITNSGGTGVTLPVATTTLAGLMSGSDKTKLNGIATGANNYVHPNSGVSAGTYNQVTVNAQGHVTAGTNQPYQTNTQVNSAINNAIQPLIDGVMFHHIPNPGGFNIPIESKKTIINVAAGVISANVSVDDGLHDGYELAINGCSEWAVTLTGNVQDSCGNTNSITVNSNKLFWWSGNQNMWIQAI